MIKLTVRYTVAFILTIALFTSILTVQAEVGPSINLFSVTNNSLMVGMDVFQLSNTGNFTRSNVLTAVSTGPEMYFKFGGVWHDLDLVDSVYDLLEHNHSVDITNKPVRRWFQAGYEVNFFTGYVEAVLRAVNNATEPLPLCQTIISDAELFGISAEALEMFSSMPLGEARQQAVGEAVLAERQELGSFEIIRVKEAFECFVPIEYGKMLFINAVNNAEDLVAMEAALSELIPVLHANQQGLIARGAAELAGDTHTLILIELNKNLGYEEYFTLLAGKLLAEKEVTGSFIEFNSLIGFLGVESAQLLISLLPESGDLTYQDKSLVENARAAFDALSVVLQEQVSNQGQLLVLEDKMAALDTIYFAVIDFSNTINNQAPKTDPPNKLLVELDAENMAMTFIFSNEAQNMGAYSALQATGLKTAFYNLAAIPEILGATAGGSSINFKEADGTPRSGDWFEIELAFFGNALVGNPTWISEIIGQSDIMTLRCKTSNDVSFELDITFNFIGAE